MYLRYYMLIAVGIYIIGNLVKYLIRFYEHKRNMMKYVQHLPCPKEYPVIGSALRFFGKNTEEIMREGVAYTQSLATPFYGWFVGFLVIIIDQPEDVYTVLTSKSCMEKSAVYRFFMFVGSLFTAPVRIWKPQRKILNTAFNIRILQSFIPIFNAKVVHLVRNIGEKVGEDAFDISELMFACTLDMICSTSMGADIDVQNGKNCDYVEALQNSLAMVTKRMVNYLYHWNFIYKRTKAYKREQELVAASERLPEKIIEARKIEYFKNNPQKFDGTGGDDDLDMDDGSPQIFIDQLFRLYSKGMVNDKNIKDHVNLMIFAGNDTSGLTVSHAILLLAMHPHIQEQVFDEIDRVYANTPLGAPSTYEHITQLNYLEQVIRETLRLYPVAPYLLRFCKEDTKISKCVIPRGATVIVSLYTMHRNKEIWGDDADDFNPDHFSVEQMSKRNPNAFAPFSLGPRNCIGMRYAYMAMKVILATVLRHYKFTTHLKMSDITTRFEITMKFVCGDVVKVHRRQ